jgi:hypothetical protein
MSDAAVATSAATVERAAEAPNLDTLLVPEGGVSEHADSGQPADATQQDTTVDQAQTAAEPEEAFDESTLYGDVQTDFSDDAYQKAAAHWSKQWGKQLDPSQPFDRSILRELMSRGQKISELQSVPAEAEEAEEEQAAEASPETKPQVDTPEAIQKFVEGVDKFAEGMIRDEVTIPQVKRLVANLFGDKVAENLDPKQTRAVARDFIANQLMILNDVLPQILNKVIPDLFKKQLGSDFPLLSDMHTSQMETRAFSDLTGEKDKAGRPLYGDLQKMKDGGALDAVFKEYPWLKDGNFKDSKDKPLSTMENRKYILRAAYNMARGRAVSPEVLSQIALKGKEQAARAADVTAASKLAAGESKGDFTQKPSDLLSDMVKFQEGTAEYKVGKATARPDNFSDRRRR